MSLISGIREFGQQKFMGNFLSVTKAKESFLDRLQKEREGNTIGSKLLEMSMKAAAPEVQIEQPVPKFELPTIQKEVSSEESSSESEEEEEAAPVKTQFVPIKPTEPKKLDQATLDDMKRQKSIQALKEMQKEKKDAIKNALSSIDSVPRNNKIVFEEPEPIQKQIKPKSILFDEDEDMEETPDSFKLKKQFEGRKGEKLFELQTRFQGDKRFQIDEKFAEVSDDIIDARKNYTREELKERKKFRKEMQDWDQNELKEERENQLSILESITGQSTGMTDKFSKPIEKGMLRFDPTKKSHQKYFDVVRGDDIADEYNESDNEHLKPQQVTEDRFYKVSEKLTEALQSKSSESKPFSIFSMLGIEHKSDEEENIDDQPEEKEIKLPTKINPFHLAKFKYESSDTDEEVEASKSAKKKKVKPQKVTKFGKYSKNGVFHYNFFFRDDDPRLKEGLKFLVKPETATPEALQEKRNKLKTIVKNSVRKAKKDQSNKQSYSKKRKVK